jgi:hypothetical protein
MEWVPGAGFLFTFIGVQESSCGHAPLWSAARIAVFFLHAVIEKKKLQIGDSRSTPKCHGVRFFFTFYDQ